MKEKVHPARYLFIIPNEKIREEAFELATEAFKESNIKSKISVSKMNQTLMVRNDDIVIEIIPCFNESMRGRKVGSIVIEYHYLEYVKDTIPYILSAIDNALNVREVYKNKISGLITTDDILKTLEEILKIEL